MIRENESLFYIWLGFVASVFVSLAVLSLLAQEYLVASQHQDALLSYVLTAVLLYGYMRLVMHVITMKIVALWSATFATMPEGLQADCAYMLIDFVSGILWIPIIMYALFNVFVIQDSTTYFTTLHPFAVVCLGAYHMDRIMQQVVTFRMDRFVHHFMTCAWTLFVLEWWPAGRHPSIFILAVIEGASKPVWYQFVLARFARRYLRNSSGNDESIIMGIDKFFVRKNTAQLVLQARLFFAYWIGIHHSVAVILVIAYLAMSADKNLFWQIYTPCITVFFLLVDLPSTRLLWAMTKFDYWNTISQSDTKSVSSLPTECRLDLTSSLDSVQSEIELGEVL